MTTATAPVELEDEADDGLNFRCGWGGTPRCDVWLPRRSMCPSHTAQILVAAAKCRVGGPKESERFIERAREIDPSIEIEISAPDEALAAKPDQRIGHRERTAATAQARREALSHRVVEIVRERGGPVRRKALSEALHVPNTRALQDAMHLAADRGDLYVAFAGVPRSLSGCYATKAALDAALEAHEAAS